MCTSAWGMLGVVMQPFVVRKVTPKKWNVFLNVSRVFFKEREFRALGADYASKGVTPMGVVSMAGGKMEIKPVTIEGGEIRAPAGTMLVEFPTKQAATDAAIGIMRRLGREIMFGLSSIEYI